LPKASPIYVNNTQMCKDFLNYWIQRCEFNEINLGAKVFDHEILMVEVLPEFLPKMKFGMLGHAYAIWPGSVIPPGLNPMITMGIADGDSKEKSLREMGLSESVVKYNLVGNKK